MNYITLTIKKYRYSLAIIYIYIFIAQLIFLAEPFILGKMIDGLLAKEYYWLFVFLAMELIANVFIYKRMVFDTKIYVKMYNELIFQYLDRDKNSNTSEKLARTDLANSIINFLEWDIHYYIYSIITLVGTLCFIFIEHIPTGFIVVGCSIPVIFIVVKFYKKIAQGTRVANTHYEQKMAIMETDNSEKIETFFKRRARVIIAQSTLQGKNWISLNMTKTIFLALALVVFTSDAINLSHGQAISIYSYITQFLSSLMSIPVGMETFTRVKDILKRIK
jgi:ABC-type bacteriocin/lantibiotic exporter with double-glycine peptidase domain